MQEKLKIFHLYNSCKESKYIGFNLFYIIHSVYASHRRELSAGCMEAPLLIPVNPLETAPTSQIQRLH